MVGPSLKSKQSDKVQSESEKLPSTLSSQQNLTAIFVKGTKVDNQRLSEALNMSYESLKSILGLESDFCMYFEDEKGNLVPMRGKMGVGSSLVNLSGRSCNATISG